MRNTYQQAAEKLGVGIWKLRQMVRNREVGIINMGHRTKFITDLEIDRVVQKKTRRAIT